jgi:hypothetical protein
MQQQQQHQRHQQRCKLTAQFVCGGQEIMYRLTTAPCHFAASKDLTKIWWCCASINTDSKLPSCAAS